MTQNEAYRVVVAPRAAQLLTSHAAFLAHVCEEAAQHLVESFRAAAQSLRENPRRCPWLRGTFLPPNTYRCLVFEKRYLLIFVIHEDVVHIDFVADCRQDYQWLLHP